MQYAAAQNHSWLHSLHRDGPGGGQNGQTGHLGQQGPAWLMRLLSISIRSRGLPLYQPQGQYTYIAWRPHGLFDLGLIPKPQGPMAIS